MPKGKPWTVEEERRLRELVEAGVSVDIIAGEFGKSKEAILRKIRRLGLKVEVVVVPNARQETTTFEVPANGLKSMEDALRLLSMEYLGFLRQFTFKSSVWNNQAGSIKWVRLVYAVTAAKHLDEAARFSLACHGTSNIIMAKPIT